MRIGVTSLGAAVLSLGMWGCAGNSDSNDSGGSPSGPSSTSAKAVVINVVGVDGSQSFSPSPARLTPGQMVVWRNGDSIRHRIVLDDRSLDTGILDPGASSAAVLPLNVGPYHCTIHPEMVGTVTY